MPNDDSYNPMTIKQMSADDRPREKMLRRGLESLSNAELLAILIGSGVPGMTAIDLARYIMNMCQDNLAELSRLTVKDLTKIRGIGEARAIHIVAALELGRRRAATQAVEREKITSSHQVYQMMSPILADLSHEEFWVVLLNNGGRVIDTKRMSQGTEAAALVDVKAIVKTAIDSGAKKLILVHNHPSGTLAPSKQDITVTANVGRGAKYFDIILDDHLIITARGYYSFLDEGAMPIFD